jgi:hypothetical protein
MISSAAHSANRVPPQAKVFISYSRSDEAFAIALGREIEARGIEVLRDVDDTLPGEEWWRRLQSLPITEAWQADEACRRNERRKQAAMLDRLMSTSGQKGKGSRRAILSAYTSGADMTAFGLEVR